MSVLSGRMPTKAEVLGISTLEASLVDAVSLSPRSSIASPRFRLTAESAASSLCKSPVNYI